MKKAPDNSKEPLVYQPTRVYPRIEVDQNGGFKNSGKLFFVLNYHQNLII